MWFLRVGFRSTVTHCFASSQGIDFSFATINFERNGAVVRILQPLTKRMAEEITRAAEISYGAPHDFVTVMVPPNLPNFSDIDDLCKKFFGELYGSEPAPEGYKIAL